MNVQGSVRSEKTLKLAKMAMLVAISIVLVLLIHFPLFPSATFLEYDPADIPIFIGTFAFGPAAGVLLTVIVSVIQGTTVSASGQIWGILMLEPDMIKTISELYQGNILLHPPYLGENTEGIPEELLSILRASNGISETMIHPQSGEKMAVEWIVSPYEIIVSDTAFYRAEYQVEGTVFSSDGAGSFYLLKPNGTVTQLDGIDGMETEKARSLEEFFQQAGACLKNLRSEERRVGKECRL